MSATETCRLALLRHLRWCLRFRTSHDWAHYFERVSRIRAKNVLQAYRENAKVGGICQEKRLSIREEHRILHTPNAGVTLDDNVRSCTKNAIWSRAD
jgi:hypothetical protein